ncbi:MAG: pilus assembly protein [Deltaproteobacteria bacterium]|nr:pilus assembly protein [Deltaproteobacteria bacterium]
MFLRETIDRARRCGLGDERGQSVVETALVVPVFVTLVFWAAFFFDLVDLRVRLQESARFAAWEATAYPLSDYESSDHDGAWAVARAEIGEAYTDLYADLDSADEQSTKARLATDFLVEPASLDNVEVRMADARGAKDVLPSEELSEVADVLGGMLDSALGQVMDNLAFNRRGLVMAEVEATVHHKLLPRGYHARENGGMFSRALYDATSFRMRERAALLADTWALHDGRSVLHEDRDLPFYKQIERGHMLGALSSVPILETLAAVIDAVGDFVEDFFGIPSFTNGRLASQSYEAGNDSDRIRLDTDELQKNFHTLPVLDTCGGGGCPYEASEYARTLQMRSEYYLGCPLPQHTPGKCDWRDVR